MRVRRMPAWWLLWGVLAFASAGCIERNAVECGDGRLCAAGTVCLPALNECVSQDRVDACAQAADGEPCSAETISTGTCLMDACFAVGCGNGFIEEGEACDDGNTSSGDGCSADCLSNELCGNGVVDRDEECDCGVVPNLNPACGGEENSFAGGQCRLDCKLHCGDGVVSIGEECDPGSGAPVPSCTEIEGQAYDRGETTCSFSCSPNLDVNTCQYVGFRSRAASGDILDVAPTGVLTGYFVEGARVSHYTDYGTTDHYYQFSGTVLRSVWSPGDALAVAVGDGGRVVRYADGMWQPEDSGTTEDLTRVWGRSGNDVYATSATGTVLHWDGSSWSDLEAPTSAFLSSVAGNANETFVVGETGTLLVHDGAGWTVIATGTSEDLRDVWSAAGLTAIVGTSGTILELRDGDLSQGRHLAATDLNAVWGSEEDGFFAAGDAETLLFYDGAVWRPLVLGSGVEAFNVQDFFDVGGVPGVFLGVAGSELLMTYEGTAWSPSSGPTANTILDLWGASTDSVFAVGRQGTIWHHDGLLWTLQESGTSVDLHAVWGSGPDDVYAVGAAGTALHFDGNSWSPIATGITDDLRDVWVSPTGTAYALGPYAAYIHDGVSWAQLALFGAPRAVWGLSDERFYVLTAGRIFRRDGDGWDIEVSQSLNNLGRSLSGNDAGVMHTAGGASSMYYDGTTWTASPLAEPDDSMSQLRAVSVSHGGEAFAVGEQGTLVFADDGEAEVLRTRTSYDLNAVYAIGHVVFMAGEDGVLETLVVHE